ncbi:unnamed protein product [Notodromas monacha]|uniref:SAM domain-containing protein n=1 Tax=Notodromas monacha TaxID=399045 RepID=A0A7R9BQG0_9CRUS|nr:unnamed protein product [Notodromas monacha]CAG0918866.1 unnamed protein product [Notodromas monacha]
MSDRFHRAARDGLLEVLKEATHKDCNVRDEDGMTPTIYAAYEGKVDALRLLVGRGGDPDKCDNFGNTALHCAAARGHMLCASFLVNFGVNLWALDNDYHTPKDLAALNNRDDILRFLDSKAAEQEQMNPKDVKHKKDKATKEAEKRIKDFEKIQKKATKRAEKEEKKRLQERERMKKATENDTSTTSSSALETIAGFVQTERRGSLKFSDLVSSTHGNVPKRQGTGVKAKIQQKKDTNEFKLSKIEDGTRTVSRITGLRRDNEVLYVPKFDAGDSTDGAAKRGKIPNDFGSKSSGTSNGDIILHEPASLFDRPGFGSVAFRSVSATLSQMNRVEMLEEEEEFTHYSGRISKTRRGTGDEGSISSGGSGARSQDHDVPWDVEDLPSDDEQETTPLHLLLVSSGLIDWLPVFNKERIDLEALMLLTESDLHDLGLPLGPRKKLVKALSDRRDALKNPGPVVDSRV